MQKTPISRLSSRRLLGAALAASLVAPFAGALADDKDTITENLRQHMPGIPIDSLQATPAEGIYELISGGQVAYVTADGKYLIAGDLIDIEQRENLTQAKQNEQRVARLAELPADRKLVYPAEGKTKHSITVLTDPTCPFCDKLHAEVPALQAAGVEVNYILTPRQGPGSKGFEISSRTLCADDPKQALDGAMKGGSVDAQACHDDVVRENMALSNELGMRGTPYTILPNGSALPGYRPANVMLEAIRGSDG